jgi:hypothetical protein
LKIVNEAKIRESLNQILAEQHPTTVLKNSLKVICPGSLTRVLILSVSFTFCLFFVYYYSYNLDEILLKAINLSNDLIFVLFASVFTVSALFVAFIKGKALQYMLMPNENGNCTYNLFAWQFYGLIIIFLFIMILNFILELYIGNFQICLPDSIYKYGKLIDSIFISLYIILILNIILETRSFVCNMYQIFKYSIYGEYIDQYGEDDGKRTN